MFGCKVGKKFRCDGVPIIRVVRRGALTFGKECRVKSRLRSNLVGRTCPAIFECKDGGQIIFGDNSGCSFSVISSRCRITIGNHVNIGGNVRIFDHDFHSLNFKTRRGGEKNRDIEAAPVKIGNDVFIGTNAVVLKGVTIGDRAVVGAGAIVARDVPSDEVWAGNPARFVKKINVQCHDSEESA